jgi:serine protease AprX
MAERLRREVLEDLIYGKRAAQRFTQDSPVLPDVWIEFSKNPAKPIDLLLTPYGENTPGMLCQAVLEGLDIDAEYSGIRSTYGGGSPEVAYNQAVVVARLYLDELVRVALPLSRWWQDYVDASFDNYLRDYRNALESGTADREIDEGPDTGTRPPLQIMWMLRIVHTVLHGGVQGESPGDEPSPQDLLESLPSLATVVEGLGPVEQNRLLYSVSRNRRARTSITRSVPAIKADAAHRLFSLSTAGLRWAVIDSGVDARHPAFLRKELKDIPPGDWGKATRVVATYDFTIIRQLLNPSLTLDNAPANIRPLLEQHTDQVDELKRSLTRGRSVDWSVLAPILMVPHDGSYVRRRHQHGTHVAGILAADWRDEADRDKVIMTGVCPDLELYDLRVFGEDGKGDEFSVMAALQFVRYLNANKDVMIVHGVNLSLSIRHDVANYACGRTPICEECHRAVGAGIVVVAAAGNDGYLQYVTPRGPTEGYRSISITDPGNAEGVITVGATHRFLPHMYGVSYFSSRGPTGDGRIKPDVVAPGEKIHAPVPGDGSATLDGTSMAAPHVSGAAALLMARHQELIGQPMRVKQILCSTATDLGRERYFQGHGVVDILRAIQSV